VVVLGEGAAVGPADLVAVGEGCEVAAGGSLGDAESGADLVKRDVGALAEPRGEAFAAGGDDMEGDFHGRGRREMSPLYDWSQSYNIGERLLTQSLHESRAFAGAPQFADSESCSHALIGISKFKPTKFIIITV